MKSLLPNLRTFAKLTGMRASGRSGSIIAKSAFVEAQENPLSSDGTDDPTISPPILRPRRLFSGWRFGITIGTLLAILVFMVNMSVLIWVLANKPLGSLNTIYKGSCSRVRTSSMWLHLGINFLSTLLLGASNYGMQCLSSPTRKEVDVAHANHNALEIGLLSVKNLRGISRKRVLLWSLLGLSSFPLHLLWNAAVFETFVAIDYLAVLVTQEFLHGGQWKIELNTNDYPHGTPRQYESAIKALQERVTSLEHLDNAACIKAYQPAFINERRNVLIVSNALDRSNGVIQFEDIMSGSGNDSWLCDPVRSAIYSTCYSNTLIRNPDNWTLSGGNKRYGSFLNNGPIRGRVLYCLSERQDRGSCQLGASLPIIISVTVCNLVKILCLIATHLVAEDDLLVTTGDAVQSFLSVPDANPAHQHIINPENRFWKNRGWLIDSDCVIKRWKPLPKRFFDADDGMRWVICIAPVIAMISLTCSVSFTLNNWETPWKDGVGEEDAPNLIDSQFSLSFLGTVVLINLPQLVVSYVYVVYNGLFTCMLLTAEWSRYAHHRKGLRVTHPRGQQRSTYYLQLPYRYAIPLLIFSGLLHWLISQTISMANVSISDFRGKIRQIKSAGVYSSLALILSASLGAILIIFALLFGLLRKYQPGMPSAATSSASISVVCHPPEDEVDAALLPVMFGIVEAGNGVRRATFSSKVVTPIVPSSRTHTALEPCDGTCSRTTQQETLRHACFAKRKFVEKRGLGDASIENNESLLGEENGILQLENLPAESLMSMIGEEWNWEEVGVMGETVKRVLTNDTD